MENDILIEWNEIPEFAKIASIADAFDAITSKRIYHKEAPPTGKEAIRRLERDIWEHFDEIFFLHLRSFSQRDMNIVLDSTRRIQADIANRLNITENIV